jgi:hypothetical protein
MASEVNKCTNSGTNEARHFPQTTRNISGMLRTIKVQQYLRTIQKRVRELDQRSNTAFLSNANVQIVYYTYIKCTERVLYLHQMYRACIILTSNVHISLLFDTLLRFRNQSYFGLTVEFIIKGSKYQYTVRKYCSWWSTDIHGF